MTVSYENNLEDVVALTEHEFSTNTAFQKGRRWSLYGRPLLFIGVFAYLAHSTDEPAFFFGGVLAALFSFLWTLRASRRLPRKAVEELHRQKPQKEVFCRHTITVSYDGFSEETAGFRHFQTWNAVFDIAFTPHYIFVYNTPATASIIPRRELGDEKFQQVSDEIQRVRNT